MKTHRMLIVGGGFGGVYAAQRLEQIFARRKDVEITLISGENFLLFTPMLAEVVSSSIEANHIVSPIRAFFRRVRFQNSDVQFIDFERRVVISSHCPKCGPSELAFDHLVLALGSTTDFHGIPGVSENARSMKTLADAMALRNHIIDVLEHADMQTDPEVRKSMLTFVVAGGGFAGTETVAEVHDFLQTACRLYSTIGPDEIRVVLVHSGGRIMPEIGGELAEYALKKLKAKGIEFVLNARVSSASEAWVELSDRQRIATKTLIWTAGVAPSPLLSSLPCKRNRRGQVTTNEYLAVPGHRGLWALGDCAEILNGLDGKPSPPTAQNAMRQGKVVAENIAAALGIGTKKPFAYRPVGMLASLGRRCAVAEIFGFSFSGFFAWWLWRTIYLLKLPGLERKVRVPLDWTLDLFFARDIVLLKLFMRPDLREVQEAHPEMEIETETSSPILGTQYFEATKLADRRGSRRELMLGRTKRAPGGVLWAIVLAGGQGTRLLPLVRELCGDERPKQFAKIVGTKSLLRHTLDRVGLQIPEVQTVIATCRGHGKYMAEEFAEMRGQRVIEQPEDRGTAAGVLFPAHWIYSQDPDAVVAVFPSDHFVLKESVFMNHIANLAAFVLQQPTRLVLLGAPADAPETEYGWIQPGEPYGRVGANSVRQVRRFWEKPSKQQARTCLATGGLWNTMVIVAKLSTLVDAGQRLLPDLTAYMACAANHLAAGRDSEMEQIYGLAPKADFSRMILEACPSLLAVFTPPELTWSDLGTPPRVRQTLALVASNGRA